MGWNRRPRKNKGWSDLSPGERRGVGLAGLIQISLLLFALRDWWRRSGEEMRGGRKLFWLPVLFVNFVGPLTYLLWGRRGGQGA